MNKDNYITSTFGIKIQNLNQAKCGRYEIQKMYGITCRAWRHDASNSSDGLPVVQYCCFKAMTLVGIEPKQGLNRFEFFAWASLVNQTSLADIVHYEMTPF